MSPQDKRRSRRIRIGQPLKIRATDPHYAELQDTNKTKTAWREEIYFVSQFGAYREGMRVFVDMPHHSPPQPQDREYLGQVVRVDKLAGDQGGVVGQLLSDLRSQ